ncbi:MAG TPA: hypothetical protein VEK73_10085 [Xanthobacteraceae bacterium]|nr:hypothetical protein [Xanthobacteraceae bacterium]
MTDVTMDAAPAEPTPGKWTRTKRALSARASVDQASSHMLRLFRSNLQVRLRTIDGASLQSACQKKIYAEVTEMLASPAGSNSRNAGWDDMYKAESLIGLLLGGAELREEIGSRLEQLSDDSPVQTEALRRDYEKLLKPPVKGQDPPSDALLRTFLLRVMELIHWNAKKKYLARPIRKEATKKVLWCMLISFLLLVAPYGYLLVDFSGQAMVGKLWSLFALYTALTAGLLGAFFSRLMRVQGNWDKMPLEEVFLHREFSYTLLRAGVGMCGALIVYFFLRSGIAAGALFPKFDEVKIEFVNVLDTNAVQMSFVMPSPALALLTFWSFLAGFSERLVPGILSSTEKQLGDAAAGRTGQK